MKKPTLKTSLALGLAFLFAVLFLRNGSDPLLTAAIEKGLGYYTPENMATVRIDDAFLLGLVKRSLPTLSLSLSIPEATPSLARDPFWRLIEPKEPVPDIMFYRRAYPYRILPFIDNNSYLVNPPYEEYLRDPYDDILFKTLYCDLGHYDAADFAILKSIQSETGDYADTHYLWGLLILRENGCFDEPEIAAEIRSVVPHIIRAAETDEVFSDLFAERIVLLYWAGFGDRVKREWIEKVHSSLTDEPGWRDAGHDESNAHTTGLALLSLIYFENGKKEQKFYARTGFVEPFPLHQIFSGGNIFTLSH